MTACIFHWPCFPESTSGWISEAREQLVPGIPVIPYL